jgi:subtilisin family serine protease
MLKSKKLVLILSTVFSTHIAISLNAQTLKTKPNWHNLDFDTDGVPGMSTLKAYELLKGRPSKTVVVGVIDSGIDTKHQDLASVIWTNTKEIAGNGIDDDNNGFIDDINGWDFLGGKDGRDIDAEQLEAVRVYLKLKEKFGDKPKKKLIKKNKADYEEMARIKEEIERKKKESEQYLPMYKNMMDRISGAEEILKKVLGKTELSEEDVKNLDESQFDKPVRQAKQTLLNLEKMGAKKEDIVAGYKQLNDDVNFNYNFDYSPRASIIGDNPEALEYGKYGNAEVQGPDAEHGTHVAGIIAANQKNSLGISGVADNVKIMVLRAVPNGDELDKDVANAIRYAVDNGAEIINMSFGKSYSPQKKWVDEAILYAQAKGVLIVAAAGNDGQNLDEKPSFPSRNLLNKKEVNNWISVGASTYNKDQNLTASFSNYGKNAVDVFSPGVAIYSTIVGNKYAEHDGTSMASPACAGVAALLKSYFPSLSAQDLRKIIMESSQKYIDLNVKIPGSKDSTNFGALSRSGGVVNAYNAVKMAIEMTEGKSK